MLSIGAISTFTTLDASLPLAPLALVHGDHPGDRDLVALRHQVGGQRLR